MTGRLGAASLSANTETILYEVPSGKTAAININLCNRSSIGVDIRMAFSEISPAADSDWIEYNLSLEGNGSLERTALRMKAGDKIIIWANIANSISAVAWGIEEDI